MKQIFGAIIASILLTIYVYLVYIVVKVFYCIAETDCTDYPVTYITEGMTQALAVIGGLVSALVIAELAITKKDDNLKMRTFKAITSKWKINEILSWIYVIVWITVGLTAFMVTLFHPEEVPLLTNLGQVWLGLAITAAYAFFGLEPE